MGKVGLFDYHIPIIYPKLPIIVTQYPKLFTIASGAQSDPAAGCHGGVSRDFLMGFVLAGSLCEYIFHLISFNWFDRSKLVIIH
jgi:hypothetical protein